MADRSSAALFCTIFEFLSSQKYTRDVRDFSRALWKQSFNYDFNSYQMGCDEALIKLGLAKKRKGLGVIYKDSDGDDWDDEDDGE